MGRFWWNSVLAFTAGCGKLMNVLPEELPQTISANRRPGNHPVAGAVTTLDPLGIAGWDDRVSAFPAATAFHSSAWLRVLHETYGHTPRYLCQSSGGRLEACLPLVEIHSPVTGRRGVSLPFTDYCPALLVEPIAGSVVWDAALALGRERRWKYLEVRSNEVVPTGANPSLQFYGHALDLRPGVPALESQLDAAVRRALRKSQASGVQVEVASDAAAMETYFQLHCLTRQRHGLPPQPLRFFQAIAKHMLAAGQGMIVTARYQGRPVAAAVFLQFGAQAIYKFGASDQAAQHVRPNNLVMWEAIRYYAAREFASLHFGRTSTANEGLRRFKRSFGAQEHVLSCFKYDLARSCFVADTDRADTAFNAVFRRLPPPLLRLAGRWLYPHLS